MTGPAAPKPLSKPATRLAFKFSWRISVLLVGLVVLLAVVMSVRLKNRLNDWIDNRGSEIVASVAAHHGNYWARFKANPKNPLVAMEKDSPDILDILILPPDTEVVDRKDMVSAQNKDAYELTEPGPPSHPDTHPKVTVTAYTFQQDNKPPVAVRVYQLPLDEGAGVVHLILSAARIEEERWSFLSSLIPLVLLAIAVGIGASYLLAAQVTRPIRALAADMGRVSRGDLDYTAKVHGSDEIGMLGRSFNRMIVSLKEAQEQEAERRALDRELAIAKEIQATLLPKTLPALSRFELSPFYEAAREVGGDYYDAIPVDGTHLGLVVADVSGKGVPGSMVMTLTRSIIRHETRGLLSAREALIRVNRLLTADIKRGMFVTAVYIVLDIKTGAATLASAGHNPVIHWSKKEGQSRLIEPGGIALGLHGGATFDDAMEEVSINIEPGDRILAYTDGAVEAMNEANEPFGDEPFYDLCDRIADQSSDGFIAQLVEQLRAHQGAAEQHDDITLLTLRCRPDA